MSQYGCVQFMLEFIARAGSKVLQTIAPEKRADIIYRLADLLLEKQDAILEANKKDVALANQQGNSISFKQLVLFA